MDATSCRGCLGQGTTPGSREHEAGAADGPGLEGTPPAAWEFGSLGFRGLGLIRFRVLEFRVSGFRGLGFIRFRVRVAAWGGRCRGVCWKRACILSGSLLRGIPGKDTPDAHSPIFPTEP